MALVTSLMAKDDFIIESQPALIEEAFCLSNQGILTKKLNGFIYLDVSNAFITSLAPLLEMPGELKSPPTAARSVGAHISVFHETENIAPQELGQAFSFQVKEVRSVVVHTRDGLKKLWMIAVDSPELESLRQSYGCPPKLQGHDFHITIGKQMPTAPEGWENIDSFASQNFSDSETIGLSTSGEFISVNDKSILATAAKVDAAAQLCLKGNGFVYLNVNNQFIDAITPRLPLKGKFTPVSTNPKSMGAHISVMYENELIGKGIWELSEAGQLFNFKVKELRYVDRKTAKGESRLWLLAVEAPALERLRLDYKLKPKLQGHDFHITLGTEEIVK